MIPVNAYVSLWESIQASVPGIETCMVVHEESDLAAMIRDVALGSVIFVAVLSGSDMVIDNPDNYQETDTCFVFILRKSDRGSLLQSEYLQELHRTQQIMELVKRQLIGLKEDFDHLSPFSHYMHGLQINTMHTEPEYNLLGCYGYGLSFKVKSNPLNIIP